jgi:hypothetical protein
MDCFFSKEMRICQRAAIAVGDIGVQQPQLLLPYLPKMLKAIEKPFHDAIVRNVVRVWQEMDIPEKMQGPIFDRCFNYLNDPQIPVAIRAFSMKVCTNIALKYPDLKEELLLVIETHLPHGSSGFKSRGKKMAALLRK